MKKRLAILSAVFMIVLLLPPQSARADSTPVPLASVTGSTLTDGATYSIGNEADLARLAELVNGGEDCAGNYFVLMNDIVLTEDHYGSTGGSSDGKWNTIGGGTFNEASLPHVFSVPFSGTFYGQGHTVSGMDLQKPVSAGLFGCIGTGGVVMDLTIAGTFTAIDWTDGGWVGGIAGINCGSIINCTNRVTYTNATTTGYQYIGGIVGVNLGLVQNCVNEGAINGYKTGSAGDGGVGGIAGYSFESTQVLNCVNTASVQGFECVGGIVGSCAANGDNEALIRNCYNTGDITAHYYCGGIAGRVNHDSVVENCYTTGSIIIDSTEAVGAVFGIMEIDSSAQNCFWLSSAYGVGCGVIIPVFSVYNLVPFTGTDLLSSEVDGTYSLFDVLLSYVLNNESYHLRIWASGSSYPTFSNTGVVMLQNSGDQFVAALGDTATFSVLAVGPSMTYQWQVSTDDSFTWTDVSTGSGANTPRYTTPSATAEMNGYRYHCKFSTGESSASALLGLGAAPEITTQPVDQYLEEGATGSLSLSATGTPGPFYQWYISSDGINYFASDRLTSSSRLLAAMEPSADGVFSYRCEVWNDFGRVTSNAVKVYLAAAPTITTQPADKTAVVGKTATFSAAAAGKPLPTYQWQIDRGSGWDDISGAIDRTYTTASVTLANDGYRYRVVATNSAGHVASDAAALTVVEEAVIPGTGDTAHPGFWIVVGLAAAACLAAGILILWKRRGIRA